MFIGAEMKPIRKRTPHLQQNMVEVLSGWDVVLPSLVLEILNVSKDEIGRLPGHFSAKGARNPCLGLKVLGHLAR